MLSVYADCIVTVNTKITVIYRVIQCSLVRRYQYFRRTFLSWRCGHRNVTMFSPYYTVTHPRRNKSSGKIIVLYILIYTVACRPVTEKLTTKQHPLLGNRLLISKYTQLVLSNAFENKHILTDTIGVLQWTVFSTRSVPRCYTEDNWSKIRERVVVKSVKRRLSRCSWRIPTVRSRYQGTTDENTAGWEDLVCAAVICKLCELTMTLWLSVVTSRVVKWSINPIFNPKPRL
jgi:hypothetical protein